MCNALIINTPLLDNYLTKIFKTYWTSFIQGSSSENTIS